MRTDRLTTLAQQTLAEAQQDAMSRNNPEVSGLHVLGAMLSDRGGTAWSILAKAIDVEGGVERIASMTDSELGRLPTTSSGAGSTGRAIMDILSKADAEAKKL